MICADDGIHAPIHTPGYGQLPQVTHVAELEPMLAESWSFAEDGLSATFELKQNAQFSYGTPVDAH